MYVAWVGEWVAGGADFVMGVGVGMQRGDYVRRLFLMV
ncbi:Uncharacterised protein [Dermatophilus congolensis]|uniref:Uncharacterized protein n=1 Tax=Dermatophilus congolensis TaxID=1863 RepID=A0AA46BP85_9MICO|nr:Uncharacterised protein [Dermatophilus congolensis]